MSEMQYQIDLISAMNEKLKHDQKMMEMIIDTSTSAFVYLDYDRDEIKTFGNWDTYFNFTPRRFADMERIYDLVDQEFRETLIKCINIDRTGLDRNSVVVRMANSNKWVKCEVNVVYERGKASNKVVRFKDVTLVREQHEDLKYMAYYDSMTGLYNRNYFIRQMSDFIEKALKEQKEAAVIFVDINDFRSINDGMGLAAGDEIVMGFGQFLSEFEGENCIVSHFNGDKYCIGIYDPCGQYSVENIYNQIRNRTKKPFVTSDNREIYISVTAGVALCPDASNRVLELINFAEIVRNRSKESGKDSIQYFDSRQMTELLHNINIENKLRRAVMDFSFQMYYQPQFDTLSGNLRGVEALIRWRDPEEGMISPALFIPLAEKNGTIIPIGQWVIEDSIRTYSEWKKNYDRSFILSVNISAIQYKRDDFVDRILYLVDKYDMDPKDLELEITETALIDSYNDINEKLNALRDYGVRISMDDFGTGYSSLSYLKSLPIDTLKIDKTFMDTVLEDDNTNIIVESIMNMVQRLGLETVAEGVETKEQLEYLKRIKCDNIQGYLLGRPQAREDIEKMLGE